MIIFRNIVSIIFFVVLAYLSTCFQKSYVKNEKFKIKNIFPEEILYSVFCLFWYVSILIVGILSYQKKEMTFLEMTEIMFLWCGMYLVSWTDFKIRKIPNIILKILFIAKIIGILFQIIIDHQEWKIAILSAGLGLLIAGGSVLLCRVFSKGQIGAGDIKLYALTGFYLNTVGFVNVMLYSVLIAGIFSIIILLVNKIKNKMKFSSAMKSTIPMAPFIFLGTNLYLIFL